jgi:hypothetical protein
MNKKNIIKILSISLLIYSIIEQNYINSGTRTTVNYRYKSYNYGTKDKENNLGSSLMAIGDKRAFQATDNFAGIKDLGTITEDIKESLTLPELSNSLMLKANEYVGYKIHIPKLGKDVEFILLQRTKHLGRKSENVFKIYRKESNENTWTELGTINNINESKQKTINITIDKEGKIHVENSNLTIDLLHEFK